MSRPSRNWPEDRSAAFSAAAATLPLASLELFSISADPDTLRLRQPRSSASVLLLSPIFYLLPSEQPQFAFDFFERLGRKTALVLGLVNLPLDRGFAFLHLVTKPLQL